MSFVAADLFAGAGGFTLGATQAGANVVWAGNHWTVACKAHAQNHPETVIACQDLCQADFTRIPKINLLLASPACQGHSLARRRSYGTQGELPGLVPPVDEYRATAWAVISCVEAQMPSCLVIENVEEFRSRWKLYPVWKKALEVYGYRLSEQVLNAADFGVPQARKRLFIVGVHRSISKRAYKVRVPGVPHVPARSIIDWALPYNPIGPDERRKAGLRPLSEATLSRIRQHRDVTAADKFLIAFYGSERDGDSLDRPLRTITTRDRFALVDWERQGLRILSASENRAAMGFPSDYRLPSSHKEAVHLLGNAVCPAIPREIVSQLHAYA